MAKALVSAAVSLLEKLRSNKLMKFGTTVREKLQILENNLEEIQLAFSKAEEIQLQHGGEKEWLEMHLLRRCEEEQLEMLLRHGYGEEWLEMQPHPGWEKWLKKFQELAYIVEDILDEYATADLKRELEMKEHQDTCWKLISVYCMRSSPGFLLSEFNLNSRLDGIYRRWEEVRGPIHEFGSWSFPGQLGGKYGRRPGITSLPSQYQRLGATSFPSECVIHGRDEDKAKLLELLLMDKPEKTDVHVISIVGMPGVGKTLLAQQLYNCPEVRNHFELQSWVFLSDNFDILRISKDLLKLATNRDIDLRDLISIKSQLRDIVSWGRFLLVFDDVWSENLSSLEWLLSLLMAGARGSRIIVTTRMESVVSKVTTSGECCHTLGLLSDDDCWSMFMEHASCAAAMGNREYSRLIRQKVIEKCQGFPLAVKILAGKLHGKHIDDWLKYLEIFEVLDHHELYTTLLLNYHHLPLHLKRCSAFCVIFPKGYEFEKKEVVLLWMAENFIPQARDSTQLEDFGGEYFHDLVSRSIFKKSSRNSSKYMMHNLFYDFAEMLFGRKIYSHDFRRWLTLPSILHISSLYYSYTCKSEVFTNGTPLRTYLSLLPVNNWFKSYAITSMFISELLVKCKKLRALSLQNYNIRELPYSIESLSLLRLLNLSGSEIRSLPESINTLCNLQTLILRNCRYLSKLPFNLGNLVRLRHFDIFGICLIDRMPLGIYNWKSIRTLSNFIVGKGSCSTLHVLKNLELLSGEMHVTGLENMIVFESSSDVILSNKKHLKVILLDWGSNFDKRDSRVDGLVLDMLQPHQNLEELTIRSYCGTQFSWLGNKAFSMSSAITILKLEDCIKCTSLPSLGLLCSLKNLSIKGLIGIKSIGIEFYGENNSTQFPTLESLSLEGLEEWEEWIHVEEDKSVGSFPKLRELTIVRCNKLRERLPKHLKLLEKLVVRNCKELVVSFSTFPLLGKLEIDECKKLICDSSVGSKSLNSFLLSNVSCAGNWQEQGFQGVEVLSIKACDELVTLLENDVLHERRHRAISVRELYVEKSENITILLEGIAKNIAGLEILQIVGCNFLSFVVIGELPSSLKRLDIRNCINLQRFWEDYGDTSSHSSSSTHFLQKGTLLDNVNSRVLQLEELFIQECPSLICLPPVFRFAPSLTHLRIKKCAKLTCLSSRSALPSVLKFLEIEDCSELTALLPRGELPDTLES